MKLLLELTKISQEMDMKSGVAKNIATLRFGDALVPVQISGAMVQQLALAHQGGVLVFDVESGEGLGAEDLGLAPSAPAHEEEPPTDEEPQDDEPEDAPADDDDDPFGLNTDQDDEPADDDVPGPEAPSIGRLMHAVPEEPEPPKGQPRALTADQQVRAQLKAKAKSLPKMTPTVTKHPMVTPPHDEAGYPIAPKRVAQNPQAPKAAGRPTRARGDIADQG